MATPPQVHLVVVSQNDLGPDLACEPDALNRLGTPVHNVADKDQPIVSLAVPRDLDKLPELVEATVDVTYYDGVAWCHAGGYTAPTGISPS